MKLKFYLIFICVFLLQSVSYAAITIGVITDYPSPQVQEIQENIVAQTEKLLAQKITVKSYFEKTALNQYTLLNSDDSVAIIIYLGLENLDALYTQKPFKKPMFFPFTSPVLVDLPNKDNTSGIKNFSYIAPNLKLKDDLMTAIELFGKGSHLLVLSSVFEDKFELISKKINVVLDSFNSNIDIISFNNLSTAIQDNDYKSILIGHSFSPKDQLKDSLDTLLKKNIPTYSLFGAHLIEDGFVAGYDARSYFNALVRKTAFAIQDVVEKNNLSESNISIATTQFPELLINIGLARKLHLNLTWDQLFSSKLIGSDTQVAKVSLDEFIEIAHESNLNYQKAQQKQIQSTYDLKVASSYLAPSVEVTLFEEWIDKDQSKVTKYPEQKLVLNTGINQIIYNNDVRLNINTAKHLKNAQGFQEDSAKLDTMFNAASKYLNVEKAFSILKLNNQNLNISKQNYSIALLKKQLGRASKQEVLRFETEMIKDKADLSKALSTYRVSLIDLYAFINSDSTSAFKTRTIDITKLVTNVHNMKLLSAINSPYNLEKLKMFLNTLTLNNSVDIKQLDEYVQMQATEVTYLKRKLYIPDISLGSTVSTWLQTGGENKNTLLNAMDEYLMNINLNASYSLFDSNRRYNQVKKSKSKLQQVKLERQVQINRLLSLLDSGLEKVRTTYSEYNYQEKLVQLSNENLILVQDQYSIGTSSLLDLIDAQETYFSAQTSYAIAAYDLIRAMYECNRYSGGLDLFFVNKQQLDTSILEPFFKSIDPNISKNKES